MCLLCWLCLPLDRRWSGGVMNSGGRLAASLLIRSLRWISPAASGTVSLLWRSSRLVVSISASQPAEFPAVTSHGLPSSGFPTPATDFWPWLSHQCVMPDSLVCRRVCHFWRCTTGDSPFALGGVETLLTLIRESRDDTHKSYAYVCLRR